MQLDKEQFKELCTTIALIANADTMKAIENAFGTKGVGATGNALDALYRIAYAIEDIRDILIEKENSK